MLRSARSARLEAWGSLSQAPLGPRRGRSSERIVRPMMARIAAFHLGLDRGVAAAPEAGQIARHLHRPLCRGQERNDEGNAPSGDGGVAVETEQLLDADCDLRPFFGFIIDCYG